jgi:Predicted ATPase (AAA+ superfamily)
VKKEYIPRITDSYIKELLEYTGAVLIEGAKGCGKTRTAKEHSKSGISLQDPANSESYFKIAATKPSILLEGETPRLIDEWQLIPTLWNGVKYLVDERGDAGQFILTGSATPPEDDKRHSGAGRISRVLMRPMSLFESGESNGAISLRGLFQGNAFKEGASHLTLENMVVALIRGGWPRTMGENERYAELYVKNYVDAVVNADVSNVDGVKRNPAAVMQLLRSLSRNISTAANIPTIKKDMDGLESISEKTISEYINVLKRIYVVEDLPAWNPSLRSSTAVRTSSKRHFVDPSIAVSVMRTNKNDLIMDFNTLGLLFESLCVRDLRVYAQSLDGDLFHYRDSNDLEADAIVHLKDGRWGAIEIKLGTGEIDKAVKNLLKLNSSIDTERMRAPSFMMVLTAGEYAYRRDDGVYVVPIGCLCAANTE